MRTMHAVPTLHHESGYSFRFFSADRDEPPHVHVSGHGGEAKFWLPNRGMATSRGYNRRELRVLSSIVEARSEEFLEKGMNFSAERVRIQPALASKVRVSANRLLVALTDGREISVPLDRFPRLAAATPVQRKNWEITAFGTALRWPDIDEDIGVATLLGVPESLVEEAAGFEIHDVS